MKKFFTVALLFLVACSSGSNNSSIVAEDVDASTPDVASGDVQTDSADVVDDIVEDADVASQMDVTDDADAVIDTADVSQDTDVVTVDVIGDADVMDDVGDTHVDPDVVDSICDGSQLVVGVSYAASEAETMYLATADGVDFVLATVSLSAVGDCGWMPNDLWIAALDSDNEVDPSVEDDLAGFELSNDENTYECVFVEGVCQISFDDEASLMLEAGERIDFDLVPNDATQGSESRQFAVYGVSANREDGMAGTSEQVSGVPGTDGDTTKAAEAPASQPTEVQSALVQAKPTGIITTFRNSFESPEGIRMDAARACFSVCMIGDAQIDLPVVQLQGTCLGGESTSVMSCLDNDPNNVRLVMEDGRSLTDRYLSSDRDGTSVVYLQAPEPITLPEATCQVLCVELMTGLQDDRGTPDDPADDRVRLFEEGDFLEVRLGQPASEVHGCPDPVTDVTAWMTSLYDNLSLSCIWTSEGDSYPGCRLPGFPTSWVRLDFTSSD